LTLPPGTAFGVGHNFGIDGEGVHVSIPGNIGPVLGEDALTERVDLDLPPALPSSSLESKVKASNPSEE
jgi:hypothetical protein